MTRQHGMLVAISLAMLIHALFIGKLLGSPFAIVAIAWAWIGVAVVRDRLEAAQEMAISMSLLLLLASIGLGIAGSSGAIIFPHLSLALMPAIVAFACVAFYVRYLEQQATAADRLEMPTKAVSVGATPRAKPQARTAPPVAVGAGAGPQLPMGANDHQEPPANAIRSDTQAA